MLTNPIPAPTILIDKIVDLTGSKGRGIIELSSCGTPVRLALDRHTLLNLGRMATETANKLFLDDGAKIVKFPDKCRKAKGA